MEMRCHDRPGHHQGTWPFHLRWGHLGGKAEDTGHMLLAYMNVAAIWEHMHPWQQMLVSLPGRRASSQLAMPPLSYGFTPPQWKTRRILWQQGGHGANFARKDSVNGALWTLQAEHMD